MKKKLVLFGTGKITEVIHYYATEECGYEIAAFTVDKEFKKEETFLGKPIISFEQIEKDFPPAQYEMFVAIGYHDLNKLRATKCKEALSKGYNLVSIISPSANLPKNTKHGHNCFIMPPAIIHPCVELGNNVFVWSGAMIGHHSKVSDNCWFTSTANIGGNNIIRENSFFAINATTGHSVKIGKECFVGANSLVTKELLDGQVVISESSKPIKLNSQQFLRFSNFTSL
jgi:sugar O-acyltransferase (sialic acid O-acetyltransferase NeuD family)